MRDSKKDYTYVVLYKIKDSLYIQQQKQEFIKGKPENPKIKYTRIYTIKTKDKKIYLAKGYGQGRNTERISKTDKPNYPHKSNRTQDEWQKKGVQENLRYLVIHSELFTLVF